MIKTVFLYAGQGSQRVGMGRDLYESYPEFRETLDKLDDTLKLSLKHDEHVAVSKDSAMSAQEQAESADKSKGISKLQTELSHNTNMADNISQFSLKELMWEGPEERLMQTEYTQPAMAAFAAGVTCILRTHGIKPDAGAGLSLGEYGALYAAGVFDAESYVKTVAFRGKVMAVAAKDLNTSMSAVLGLDADKTEEACERASIETGVFVTVANYNCPGQYVICGDEKAVARAEELAAELGAKRCMRLKVSAPFHTRLLEGAGEKLGVYFENVHFNKPLIPVAMNVTGRLLSESDDIRKLLCMQVSHSVRFEDDICELLKLGAERFIEIGPGNALSGFVKKTAAKLGLKPQIASITTAEDIAKLT